MEHLKSGNASAALHLLRRAHDLLTGPEQLKNVELLAITLNNLGCYYKKTNKLGLGLQYFQKALDLEPPGPAAPAHVAGTHLNMSAIRAQLGNHDAALAHATAAVQVLEAAPANANTQMTKIMALHSTAVEYEALKRGIEAAQAYKTGLELANLLLGQKHPLTKNLERGLMNLVQEKPAPKRVASTSPHLPRVAPKSRTNARRIEGTSKPRHFSLRSLQGTPTKQVSRENAARANAYGSQVRRSVQQPDVGAKLGSLQKQLDSFEKKYRLLEQQHHRLINAQQVFGPIVAKRVHSVSVPQSVIPQPVIPQPVIPQPVIPRAVPVSYANPTEEIVKAAQVIQRHWRTYMNRKDSQSKRLERARIKAHSAIKELESLKQLALEEGYFKTAQLLGEHQAPLRPSHRVKGRVKKLLIT